MAGNPQPGADRITSADAALFGALTLAGAAFYAFLGWGVGAAALDSDTLSQVLAWHLLQDATQLQIWNFSTPKFLTVVFDGVIYDLGGETLLWLRGLAAALLLAPPAAWLLRRALPGRGAGAWVAAALGGLFLLFHRTIAALTMGANSTVLALALLLWAAALLLSWPRPAPIRVALLALFAAGLVRTEYLFFLALAAAALGLGAVRNRSSSLAGNAALAAVFVLAAWGLDHVAPTKILGRWTSSAQATSENTATALEVVDSGAENVGYELEHYRRRRQSYFENMGYLLGRLFRPWAFWAAASVAGLWALSLVCRRAALLIFLMAAVPLAYAWLILRLDLGLFDRYLLPTLAAGLIAGAAALGELWHRAAAATPRFKQLALRAAAIAMAAAVLAVCLRDGWNLRWGYLAAEAELRARYDQGLEVLRQNPVAGRSFLIPGKYLAHTALNAPLDMARSRQSLEAVLSDRPPEFLAGFDYVIHDRDDSLTESLLVKLLSCENESCGMDQTSRRLTLLWASPGCDLLFFSALDGVRPDTASTACLDRYNQPDSP